MPMKAKLMKTGSLAPSRGALTILACLIAATVLLGGPRAGWTQTAAKAKATEQLFDAVHANDFAAVQASVAAGADVEASDRWGMTPMELAIDKGYFEIGHYLVAVRNFSRSSTDQRPAPPVVSDGSPFASPRSGQPATSSAAQASPLGPLSRSAVTGGSRPAASSVVDIETSGGRSDGSTAAEIKDNPFDPNAPAHGSGAFSVGEVGGGASEALAPLAARSASLEDDNDSPDASVSANGSAGSGFSDRVIGVGGGSR